MLASIKFLFYPLDRDTQLTNLADLGNGTYQKIENSNEAYIEYSFIVDSDYPIYLYLDSNNMKLAQIEFNGKNSGKYFDIKQYDIIQVQDYVDIKKGEELKIRVKALESILQIDDIQIYYENPEYLKSCYNYQNENNVKLERISDSFIRGIFNNTDNRYHMMFTIPYNKGWKVYIDGKKVKSVDKTGIFLSISDIPAGEHEIILKYIPVGFKVGTVIAVLAFIFLILMIHYDMDKNTNYRKKVIYFIAFVLLCCVVFIIVRLYEPKQLIRNHGVSPVTGDVVYLGSIEQDGNMTNGKEPIEWEILETKDDKALLISKYSLAYMSYAGENIASVWEDSEVRKWANNEFYQQVFDDEEKDYILLTKVDNKGCSTKFTDAGADTEDYVFILDKDQIKRYYGVSSYYDCEHFYSQNALCTPTKYAMETSKEYQYISEELYEKIMKRHGYSDEIIGRISCNYWVRTPGLYTTINTLTVDDTGSIFEIGTFGTNQCYVRPAIWVDIDVVNKK